jgi:hypothetical protein
MRVIGYCRRSLIALLAALSLGVLLSGCTSGMEGAWTTERGRLEISESQSSWGIDAYAESDSPAGGVIVVDDGGSYSVTLVGADGHRYPASQASMQGSLLRFEIRGGGSYYLSQTQPNRLDLLFGDGDGRPDKGFSISLVPGEPVAAPTATDAP